MSAVAVVQARMSSTRLPGKVLADVCGEPLLALLLHRLGRAESVAEVVVATSTDSSDDPVESVARALGTRVHRGSLDDVLGRIVGAAAGHDGPVVRITADCPFTDPGIVDGLVRLFEEDAGCVYASNVEPRTYPDGTDVEVVDGATLARLDAELEDPSDREHVTLAIRRQPERFPQRALVSEEDLGDLRWTVDTAADLAFVQQVAARLGERRHEAGMHEVLEAIRREPSLAGFDEWRRG